VLARDQGVFDREVAIETAPDHGGTPRQIEFLKEKPQSVSRHLAPMAAAPRRNYTLAGAAGTALAREALAG